MRPRTTYQREAVAEICLVESLAEGSSPDKLSEHVTPIQVPNRPVLRYELDSYPPEQELEKLIAGMGVTLGPLIPTKEDRLRVLRLLYKYRHLDATSLADLTCTDVYAHRIKIAPGVKPFSKLNQMRWPLHTEWWMRKLVEDGVKGGIFERTGLLDGRLSPWNALAVMVDKVENPTPQDEPRLTFDYSHVKEELPAVYMELSSRVHDYLSQPAHKTLMQADLKYAYHTVELHPEDRKYFAFNIAGYGQLQPTKMPQGSKSSCFGMSETVHRAFGPLKDEPSLLHADFPEDLAKLIFYMDDFFGGYKSFEEQFTFLAEHFFPRIEWARLILSFKKLKLFMDSIVALGVRHNVGGFIQIKESRLRRIAEWPTPKDATGVRSFIGSMGISRRWIRNYSEIIKPLSRLTGKVEWTWTEREQLAFEIIKIKASSVLAMHGLDYSLAIHFYTDASSFAGGLAITQYQTQNEVQVEVPVLYDSFPFRATELKYPTYKKELGVMVKMVTKYGYLCRHPKRKAIIHTDHKPLTHFLSSGNHEGIYGHWADQLRRLNIEIVYIPGPRNKVADGLSRTLFYPDREEEISQEGLKMLQTQGPQWIWKDGKNGFEAFLRSLSKADRAEVTDQGTLHGIDVFSLTAAASVSDAESWEASYLQSCWFSHIYMFLTGLRWDETSPTFTQSMAYRIDPNTKVLWKHHREQYLPCIPEDRVLGVLRKVHDEAGHWGKAGTLAKLHGIAYWPFQSADVSSYIKGCIQCARHGPATRSQPLHPVVVQGPFHLIGMDFIGPLPLSGSGSKFILHIIDYFSRFSMAFPSAAANLPEVIQALKFVFVHYATPRAVYMDRGQHF